MYALPVSEGVCVLDNSPFYAFDISLGDFFLVEEIDREYFFSRVIRRGGHSTYRIKLPIGKEHGYFLEHWRTLEGLGCTYEGSSVNDRRLYSLDVPPEVDVFEVFKILEGKEVLGIWVFEEAHYFHPEGI
jgi:hypothetical protein